MLCPFVCPFLRDLPLIKRVFTLLFNILTKSAKRNIYSMKKQHSIWNFRIIWKNHMPRWVLFCFLSTLLCIILSLLDKARIIQSYFIQWIFVCPIRACLRAWSWPASKQIMNWNKYSLFIRWGQTKTCHWVPFLDFWLMSC